MFRKDILSIFSLVSDWRLRLLDGDLTLLWWWADELLDEIFFPGNFEIQNFVIVFVDGCQRQP